MQNFFKNKKQLTILAIVLVVVSILFGVLIYFSNTPNTALNSMVDANKRKDYKTFQNYVDLQSITDEYSNEFAKNNAEFDKASFKNFLEAGFKTQVEKGEFFQKREVPNGIFEAMRLKTEKSGDYEIITLKGTEGSVSDMRLGFKRFGIGWKFAKVFSNNNASNNSSSNSSSAKSQNEILAFDYKETGKINDIEFKVNRIQELTSFSEEDKKKVCEEEKLCFKSNLSDYVEPKEDEKLIAVAIKVTNNSDVLRLVDYGFSDEVVIVSNNNTYKSPKSSSGICNAEFSGFNRKLLAGDTNYLYRCVLVPKDLKSGEIKLENVRFRKLGENTFDSAELKISFDTTDYKNMEAIDFSKIDSVIKKPGDEVKFKEVAIELKGAQKYTETSNRYNSTTKKTETVEQIYYLFDVKVTNLKDETVNISPYSIFGLKDNMGIFTIANVPNFKDKEMNKKMFPSSNNAILPGKSLEGFIAFKIAPQVDIKESRLYVSDYSFDGEQSAFKFEI